MGDPRRDEPLPAVTKRIARGLLLTHFRASRFADLAALAAEAETAFGRPAELAEDLGVIDV